MPRAERDIDEVVVAIQRKAPVTAARWHARMTAAIGRLEFMPTRFGLIEEAEDIGHELREYIFGRRRGAYRVIYTLTGQTVYILRVLNAARGRLTLDDLS